MPRKTKEINEEITEKKAKSTTTTKAKAAKSKATKTKTEKTAKAKVEKAAPKKTTKSKTSEKAPKKVTKTEKETKVAKKESTKKTDSTKSTAKKSTSKATTKKVAVKKTAKKSTKESKATKTAKITKAKSAKVATPSVVEYYDLPYKYNQTVVKVLYQNPTTLFVYWEISDEDIENYKNTYGDNFFETTRPALVVHNDTMNYHFEVDINDFANSWYFNINDSKCNYRVDLVRKPVFYNEKIKSNIIHITSSNKIETPNDKILFSTDEPNIVYFRNVKNNNHRKVNLQKLLEELNLANKDFNFPIVHNVRDLYKNIYHIEDSEEFSISLTNPSSGNPSSHSLSSRFM